MRGSCLSILYYSPYPAPIANVWRAVHNAAIDQSQVQLHCGSVSQFDIFKLVHSGVLSGAGESIWVRMDYQLGERHDHQWRCAVSRLCMPFMDYHG